MSNNTKNTNTADQILRMAEVNLAKRKSIGAVALQNKNKVFSGGITSTKPENIERIYKNITLTASAVHTTGTFTTDGDFISVEDNRVLIVGDIVSYGSMDLLVNSVSVDRSGESPLYKTNMSFLGGSEVEIPQNGIIKLSSNATAEGDDAIQDRKMSEQRKTWNYTQIIVGQSSMTGTLAQSKGLAGEDLKAELLKDSVRDFENKLIGTVMSRIRKEVVTYDSAGKEVIKRIAGGIPYFTKNTFDENGDNPTATTVNQIAVDDVLEKTHINQVFVKAINNGGTVNTIAGTADLIATLADAEQNKVQVLNSDGTSVKIAGGGIQKFKSPIEVDGNVITHFLLSDELEDGEVLCFNKESISIEQMKNRATYKYTDAKTSTDDNHRIFFRDEVSIIIQKAQEDFYYLTGCEAS